jgi:arabinan endo-1,5-alpha-L-arabinosidase
MNVHQWRGRFTTAALILALALLVAPAGAARQPHQEYRRTYRNPLAIEIHDDGRVESCADPTLIHGQRPQERQYWFMYCTKDPLNDDDRNASGDFNFHNTPMLRSSDLVHWTYMGDAFASVPAWGEPTSGIWAPEISYFNGQYYLYYTMTDPKPEVSGEPNCGSEPAIGVATSSSPLGPWQDHGSPVVAPRRGGPGCNFLWTFDPDVITAGGQRYIYYGSYYGGIQVRPLSDDGFTTDPAAAVQITIANRYEGAEVINRGGYYYLFASAGNCCNGPVTGYSVFAGRSHSPIGPFVERDGVSLLAGRVGGTPVIAMNGNRWVGTGHNSVFQDLKGQYWTVYHAVDRGDPYFAGTTDFTRRPVLLDALDWIDGWPTLRGGTGPSDTPQPAPAAQPGDQSNYKTPKAQADRLGRLIPALSDEFSASALGPQWSWIRQPGADTYSLADGAFSWDTQAADLFQDNNNASLLVEAAPRGDYAVETRVSLDLPAEGCCQNFVQAGAVIYGDDDNYLRLMHVSIWETRQTEFAKEFIDPFSGLAHFGGTLVGPPAEITWLRIVKRTRSGAELYTGYTSRDGQHWVRGGTWTHQLGASARIGLAAMGGGGFTARFDYVRVYRLDD